MTMVRRAAIAVCMTAALLASQLAVAAPSVYPTGVTRYDPSAAYNCDVLFSAADQKTYLIDMDGHVLHRWDLNGFPSKMLDPALTRGVKGEVGLQLSAIPATRGDGGTGAVPGRPAEFRNETFGLVDWSGNVLWRWGSQAPGGAALQHHDWDRLPGGDTLILANRPGMLKGFGRRQMLDDVLYEVDPRGGIVWTWIASAHLSELGLTASQLQLMERRAPADYLHLNDMEPLGPNRWEKAGDDRFAADNIMISSRNASIVAIISRKTGHIVWRLGPDFPAARDATLFALGGVAAPGRIGQLSGQHDAHLIPEGLPGAGDLLLFDNEGEAGFPPQELPLIGGSRALQIDPIKRTVVWQYTGTKTTFYSPYISSVQRLPNGNTLIDEGIDGRFFQVTPRGRIVWEYVAPMRGAAGGSGGASSVYRIQGVPYDWVPLPGPHSEAAVRPPALEDFHVPTGQ